MKELTAKYRQFVKVEEKYPVDKSLELTRAIREDPLFYPK